MGRDRYLLIAYLFGIENSGKFVAMCVCARFFDSYFVGALALTIRSSLCHYETFFGIFGRCSLLRFFVR